jgi:hypothetical protein
LITNNGSGRFNPNHELNEATTSSEVFSQIYRNAAEGRTDNLVDTLLPKNREILRAYQVLNRDPFTQTPTSIRVWDIFIDIHEINKRLEKFFEERRPKASIVVFDRANSDHAFRYNRSQKYPGVYVFTIANTYYQDNEHVKPDDLQALDPKLQSEYGDASHIIGEVPADQNPPINAIFTQAGLIENLHPDFSQVRNGNNRFCHRYNCPVCQPVEYTVKRFREEGGLSGRLYLGESAFSQRNKNYDEFGYLEELHEILQTTALMTQSAALMSDVPIIERADVKTLEHIKKDYEEMLKS